MFRHELSPFLKTVLDTVARMPRGIAIDPAGDPDPNDLATIVRRVRATPDEVVQALNGLLAAHCLVERVLEFEGAQPLTWWSVHPQCVRTSDGAIGEAG